MRFYIDICVIKTKKIIVHLVDDVPLGYYFVAYFIFVIGFGLTYCLLTPYGHGVKNNFGNLSNLKFLDGLYFSVVTVSSLGYGDLQPVGFSKVLACFEVLFGLAFMGIVIARITSRRLSHHVLRLFSSDAQKRIEEFSEKFSGLEIRLTETMKVLGVIYQKTPDPRPPGGNDKEQVIARFKMILNNLNSSSTALASYFSSEVEHDNYFSIVSNESVHVMGNILDRVFFGLGQLVISLPPEAKIEILDGQCRQRISETLAAQQRVCKMVQEQSKNQEIISCFATIQDTCKRVLEGYFTMPAEIKVSGQPDQIAQRADMPQEPVE